MSDEQEAGFTFVDRRHTTEPAGGDAAEQAADVPEEAGSQKTTAEQPSGSPFQIPNLNTTDRILMCINWLHEGAWIALGLVRNPATDEIEQDLEGARAAIDCIAYLVSKVEPNLDEPAIRELKTLVRDLQLNFVQQQSRTSQPTS
jgi:Domain of unknown function (DUF1844).